MKENWNSLYDSDWDSKSKHMLSIIGSNVVKAISDNNRRDNVQTKNDEIRSNDERMADYDNVELKLVGANNKSSDPDENKYVDREGKGGAELT